MFNGSTSSVAPQHASILIEITYYCNSTIAPSYTKAGLGQLTLYNQVQISHSFRLKLALSQGSHRAFCFMKMIY